MGAQTPLEGMQTGAATEEKSLAGPQKVKQDYHKTQQLHPEEHDQEKLQPMSSPSRLDPWTELPPVK